MEKNKLENHNNVCACISFHLPFLVFNKVLLDSLEFLICIFHRIKHDLIVLMCQKRKNEIVKFNFFYMPSGSQQLLHTSSGYYSRTSYVVDFHHDLLGDDVSMINGIWQLSCWNFFLATDFHFSLLQEANTSMLNTPFSLTASSLELLLSSSVGISSFWSSKPLSVNKSKPILKSFIEVIEYFHCRMCAWLMDSIKYKTLRNLCPSSPCSLCSPITFFHND